MKITLARATLTKAPSVVLSIIFISLISTNISSAIDPGTIAGVWLLDEGSGNVAADSSGNGNDGEILGEPAWVDGVYGKALEFDGGEHYINCGNDASLDLTEEFTLMAWGKCPGEPGSSDFMCHTGCGGYYLGVSGTDWGDGALVFPQQDDGNSIDSKKKIFDDEWHHVAGTYDGEKVKIYIDGELDVEADYTPKVPFANTGNLQIGSYGDASAEFFEGTMDEVAVFNVALSADDVKEIAANGLAGVVAAVSPREKLTTTWGKIKAEN